MARTEHIPGESAPDRLETLGLDLPRLQRVQEAALGGYQSATRFHPVNAAGLFLWLEATAALARVTVGEHAENGWTQDDLDQQRRVVNTETGVVIIVQTGDDLTGVENVTPSTRKRGPATRAKVVANGEQLALFDDLEQHGAAVPPVGLSWVLLLRVRDGALHAELSLPEAIGDDGLGWRWRERIILLALPLDTDEIPEGSDAGPTQVNVDWR